MQMYCGYLLLSELDPLAEKPSLTQTPPPQLLRLPVTDNTNSNNIRMIDICKRLVFLLR